MAPVPNMSSAVMAALAMTTVLTPIANAGAIHRPYMIARQDDENSPAPEEDAGSDSPEWQDLTCNDRGADDERMDEQERWNLMGVNNAWDDAVNDFKGQENNKLSFTRSVSTFLGGPPSMSCEQLSGGNGCTGGTYLSCESVKKAPAGHLLLNSFMKINNIVWNMYEALQVTHGSISGDIGSFSDTFAPQKDKGMDIDIILDIVTLGYSAMAAPIWNSALKSWKFAQNSANSYDSLAGFVTDMTNAGISTAKDITQSDDNTLSTQNEVSERLNGMVKVWRESMNKMITNLYSGKDEDIEKLGKIIADGKMLIANGTATDDEHTSTNNLNAEDLYRHINRGLYAAMIPTAWKISDKGISPFILDSGEPCDRADKGDWGQLANKRLNGVQGSGKVCIDDRAYFLVGASGDCSQAGTPFDDPDTGACKPFEALPGIDKLDGKAWGGVSREDIVIGSMNTFRANGNKNLDSRMTWSKGMSNDQLEGLGDGDLRTAYTFGLPVCDLGTAWSNFHEKSDIDTSKYNYPCQLEHFEDFNKKDIPPPYDCKGSGMCKGAANLVRNCDRAVNHGLDRNDDVNYGSADSGKENDGARNGNCKIFIAGPEACTRTGNEMWDDYQDLKNEDKGGCGACGSKHWGYNNECRTTVNYVA